MILIRWHFWPWPVNQRILVPAGRWQTVMLERALGERKPTSKQLIPKHCSHYVWNWTQSCYGKTSVKKFLYLDRDLDQHQNRFVARETSHPSKKVHIRICRQPLELSANCAGFPPISHNCKKFLEKFLDPDPDDFQNLTATSLSQYTV